MDNQQPFQPQFQPSSQPPTPRRNSTFLWILLGVIIGIAIGGAAVYFITNKSSNDQSNLQSTKEKESGSSASQSAADETANWRTFENKEIGVSFKYPAEYGEFYLSIYEGEEGGKVFYGTFNKELDMLEGPYKYLAIAGETDDFYKSRARGTFFLDFAGYYQKNGKYYHYNIERNPGDNGLEPGEIVPVKTITADGQKALVVNEESYVNEKNISDYAARFNPGKNGGALINLPNSGKFKGLAVLNADIKVLPQAEFEKILATFKFAK